MIVMGTHGWKGLVHFFTGSITEDIVNHANLPIWTFTVK
jgi:nucleotide-binding universal stress UspA family protein